MEIVVLIMMIAFGMIFLVSFFVLLQKETAKAERCTAIRVETVSDFPISPIEQKHRAAISFAVKVKKKYPNRPVHRSS